MQTFFSLCLLNKYLIYKYNLFYAYLQEKECARPRWISWLGFVTKFVTVDFTPIFRNLFLNAKKHRNSWFPRISAPLPSSRSDRIWTCGLCVPNAALYQTEPHFVICFCFVVQRKTYYIIEIWKCQQAFLKKLQKVFLLI